MKRTIPILTLLLGGIFLVLGPYLETPFANPPQPPEPTPPGERWVFVISETSTRTPQEALVLSSLARYLQAKNQPYQWMDRESHSDLEPYLDHLEEEEVNLPAVLVTVPPTGSHDGAYLLAKELPYGPREAIAMVEEALERE